MESNESKEAKKQARIKWKKDYNWKSEESYKRYQEANGLIRRRPLRPKGAPRDVDKYKCELKHNEFISLYRKELKAKTKLLLELKSLMKQPWPNTHKEIINRARASYKLEELENEALKYRYTRLKNRTKKCYL